MNASSRKTHFRPALEFLDGRDVPAVVNLTTHLAAGEANGALFQQTDAQPTGTGHISSFVRVQQTGLQGGYNTDARPLQFSENSSPKFTRSLRLADVPVVSVGGTAYRQFLLDINQNSSSPLLSLDQLRVYLGDQGNLTGYNTTAKTLAGLAPVFDLDAGGDNSVLLNYSLNHGSGSGDAFVLIPNSLFASATPNPYVYLYSAFGQTAAANAGFEEWAVLPVRDTAPTGSLSGRVYLDAPDANGNTNGVFDAGEAGIGGVWITLTGVDDLGGEVSLETVTDPNGNYSFTDLRPGVYNLTESQPFGYADGQESVGSLGGDVGEDMFTNICLGAGQMGIAYDFGELEEEEYPG
jgi:hypothetical protein